MAALKVRTGGSEEPGIINEADELINAERYERTLPEGIEPVLSWKSVVSMVKKVKPGDTIGYGRSFTVGHPMIIATIPTGYADGYPRLLSNKGWVLINEKRAPVSKTYMHGSNDG